MDDGIKLFFVLSAIAASGVLGYIGVVLVNAVSKRANARVAMGDEELQYLRAQVEELDQLRERLAELENRMDFAERVLPRPEGRSVDD